MTSERTSKRLAEITGRQYQYDIGQTAREIEKVLSLGKPRVNEYQPLHAKGENTTPNEH